MSPPPAPDAAAPRRSQGEEPEESRQSREGPADPSVPEDPRTPADVDVTPPNACKGRLRDPKRNAGTGGGNALDGRSPGRHRRAGSLRGFGRSTSSRRERSPEAVRVRPPPWGRGESTRGTTRGQGPRERHPSARGESLGGRSPWTLRRRKAPRGTAVDAAREVPKPRTRHAAGFDAPRINGSAAPSCVEGWKSPGEEASSGMPVFGPAGRCGGAVMDL
jgi:hypothetical protein